MKLHYFGLPFAAGYRQRLVCVLAEMQHRRSVEVEINQMTFM